MNSFMSPKGQFTGAIMPMCIFRKKGLSLGAKAVYAVLVNCTPVGKEFCFPSQAYLSECLGVSIRSVQNYIKELADQGFIVIQRGRFGTSPKYFFIKRSDLELRSNALVATVYDDDSPAKSVSTPATFSHTPANSAYLKYNNINKYKFPPLPPVKQKTDFPLESGFNVGGGIFSSGTEKEFWTVFNLYPRKENPAAALRLWVLYQAQGSMPPLEKIKDAIEANKASNPLWRKENGRFVPYLVNWLRDCRWNDEFPNHDRVKTGDTQAGQGVYQVADFGWCYLNKTKQFKESQDVSVVDPDFEQIWEACPFERGPKVVAMGMWKALKLNVDAECLIKAVSQAPQDYNRLLWRFLDEYKATPKTQTLLRAC